MPTKFGAIGLLIVFAAPTLSGAEPGDGPAAFPVTIQIDASQAKRPLKPIWRFFGADEPNYAYMKDGRKLLAELGRLRPGRSTSGPTTC